MRLAPRFSKELTFAGQSHMTLHDEFKFVMFLFNSQKAMLY